MQKHLPPGRYPVISAAPNSSADATFWLRCGSRVGAEKFIHLRFTEQPYLRPLAEESEGLLRREVFEYELFSRLDSELPPCLKCTLMLSSQPLFGRGASCWKLPA